ncbi:MAG: phenylacetate--CoA ligase family protein [Vicinamibacteria bacterium]
MVFVGAPMIEAMRTQRLLWSLRASSGRSPGHLQELQEGLLRKAVANAHANVPFYRRVWDERGFAPADLRCVEDLTRMPIIGGLEVRKAVQRGELAAKDVDPSRCVVFSSSGWSRAPIHVRRGSVERSLWRAAGLRMQFEHGFRWRHATVQFDSPPAPPHVLQRLGISRTTWIPRTMPIEQQLATFVEARAHVVVGTPTVVRRLCRALETTGRRWTRPQRVFCQGEMLDAETRGAVERVLGVNPLNLYGLTEVGYVAWQCEEREGLHVNAELFLVEVLRDGWPAAPGELGTIVVTDLRGRTMPLLRYDTGDLAVAAGGPCPCARSLPLLGSIEGRAQASALLADGRIVTPRALVDHLAGTLRLEEYRLHQETRSRFRLELAPSALVDRGVASNAGHPPCDKDAVLRRLRELLGDVEVSIVVAASWPDHAADKTHAISSAVPIQFR